MIAIEVCEREQERRMEYRNGVSIEHRQYHAQVKDRPEMWLVVITVKKQSGT